MGRVVASYGVHGWVKVAPLSGDPAALLDHDVWWLKARDANEWREFRVTDAKMHGATLIAALTGIANREDAARHRGAEVAVPRSALPPVAAGEIYVSDLVGMTVVNRQAVTLGKVVAVQDFGAHPVLRVQVEGGIERLIPFVTAYIDGVDLAQARIDVDWESGY
jgi:16S rRNA processing protein RimM